MADALSFVLRLEDQLSPTASKAQRALKSLEGQVKKETDAISALDKKIVDTASALQSLDPASKGAAASAKRLSASIEKSQAAISKKRANLELLNGALPKFQARAAKSSVLTDTLSGALSGLGIPLELGAAGVAAMAASAAAAGVAMVGFAISTADSKRSLMLQWQAMLGSRQAAEDLDAAISQIATTSPLTKDALEGFGSALAKAGLQGDQLRQSLETLAIAQAVSGEAASSALQRVIKTSSAKGAFQLPVKALAESGLEIPKVLGELAKLTGKSLAQVDDELAAGKISVADGLAALNAATRARWGDVAAKQALSLGSQFGKLKDSIGDLFENAAIEPFLIALKSVLDLFSENSVTGKALGAIMTEVFGGLSNVLARLLPTIRVIIGSLILGMLEVWIATKPVREALAKVFDFGDEGSTLVDTIGLLAKAVGMGLVVAVTASAAAFGAFATALRVVMAVARPVMAALNFVVDGLQTVVGVVLETASNIGGAIIDGIVGGISAGASTVWDALKGLALGAVGAVKETLGIASPSRVFAQLGAFTAEGFVGGLEAGTADVGTTLDSMVTPTVGSTAGATPTSAGARAGSRVDVGGITMTINGVQNAEQLQSVLPTLLAQAFEQIGFQVGAEVPA